MAEGVLFNFAGKLLVGLASLAHQELGLPWGVKEEITKLKDTFSLIKGVLRDAEEQQRNNNHEVTVWLGQLKDLLYDVDDLLDDFSTEALRRKIMRGNEMVKKVRVFFSKSNQLPYSLKIGYRVKAIRERLDKIAADGTKFHFTDSPIVKLLLQSKLEENVSIVPVIGIGGLGKTTLAKMVFNDKNVGEHFQLKLWVCVSEKFELKLIVEKIIEAATGSKPERDLQMETLQNILRGNINGKKYLLVLDDVWNEVREKWLNLRNLLLGGARGSWIVITTRSGLVAEITSTVLPHELEGLSKSQSWSLLKQMAFKEQSHESNASHFEAIGMEIVEKCKGVPLALRAIGSVLFKRTEAEWVKVKNNIVKYITQQESGIMPVLKLSYDHLPPHLRQCFA
ncbi:putative disease resistance protein RGA3 [Durio zibethinus]|uniref:Disease resistance protein RGA3 n=1 Tax=Durio zibethinus TaxID=66656 RepID=A0A6P5X1D1_DURZI|nr:putative disease resistance protein RGA3 [Durio zibethinus]